MNELEIVAAQAITVTAEAGLFSTKSANHEGGQWVGKHNIWLLACSRAGAQSSRTGGKLTCLHFHCKVTRGAGGSSIKQIFQRKDLSMSSQNNRNQADICPWCNSNLVINAHTENCQWVQAINAHIIQISGSIPGERIRRDIVPPLRLEHMGS